MVIIKVWGGIGNQLFQFVFGEYIKYRFNQHVVYDVNSYISVDGLRVNELDALETEITYVNSIKFSKYRGVKNRLLRFIWQLSTKHHYIDEMTPMPSKFQNSHIYFFQGYWQTIEYYDWLIKNVPQFSLKSKTIPIELQELSEKILTNSDAVSIHIRRGDYFKPQNISVFGVCDANYYHKSLATLQKVRQSLRLFVFSDDLEWVKDNLKLPEDSIYVPNYAISQFAYIELMSKCRHHIISNSSFSWWGSVLNSKEDAVVIAPSVWMKNTNKTLALDNWIKIPV